MGLLHSGHEQTHLGVHGLLNEAVSINNMVQRVDKLLADFLSVQFLSSFVTFYNTFIFVLFFTFPEALVQADLHSTK